MKKKLFLDFRISDQFSQLIIEIEIDVGSEDDNDNSLDSSVDSLNLNKFPVEGYFDGKKGKKDEEYNFNNKVQNKVDYLNPLNLKVS